MGIFNEFYKKEKPIFTGIARGVGGFGFGAAGGSGFSASGGSKYQPGDGYVYHAFTNPNSDNFIADGDGTIDVLIVAGGGGGGGGYYSGGAGAGGLVFGPNVPITAGTYAVTVGAGGAGSVAPGVGGDGVVGGNSSFDSVTALGGGFGGSGPRPVSQPPMYGEDGGSGGGAPQYAQSANGAASPQPVPSDYTAYGNAGGPALPTRGAGGGGAGAAGGTPADPVMVGGDGQPIPAFAGPKIPILSPVVPLMGPDGTYYAGGGGGGQPGGPEANVKGGFGGGGNGNPGSSEANPTGFPGTDYLGGGGGGIGNPLGGGGDGGDGIVLVRYLA